MQKGLVVLCYAAIVGAFALILVGGVTGTML